MQSPKANPAAAQHCKALAQTQQFSMKVNLRYTFSSSWCWNDEGVVL
jgi:hypothetical protein